MHPKEQAGCPESPESGNSIWLAEAQEEVASTLERLQHRAIRIFGHGFPGGPEAW